MKAQVYIRRRFGKRIEAERASTPLVGELQFGQVKTGISTMAVLSLHATSNTNESGTLAQLYEPVMVGLGNWWISFRGYESFNSDGGPTSYMQEWRCYVSMFETGTIPK